jgi:preprotein translocase subunit SecA
MFQSFLKLLKGNPNQQILNGIQPIVEKVNAFEENISQLSDTDLQAKTNEFKIKIQEKINATPFQKLIEDDVPKLPGQLRTTHDKALSEILEELLPEAFAVCREASKRVLKMRHYDVQLIGGVQLHRTGIAEMQTGEGKTLVCTLPAYLNALSGRGVHIITVNDYLAKRDSEWMGKLFNFLGLSVGLIVSGKNSKDRQIAYRSDITYGTNNEFGFDYLRDNMASDITECVQKDYYMAIVDEVDSILIDEARTPLIISGMPDRRKKEIYLAMNQLAKQLKKTTNEKDLSAEAHYFVDEKAKNAILTEAGILRAEELLKVNNLWDPESNLAHHLIQALRAKELFVKDTDYIVQVNPKTTKKEVVIVDEFTGRLMEGRRWGDGLHQAVEAKENVAIQEETLTMASITFQNLFRLYPKLAGMTGTASTEAEEFKKIYNLHVLTIPTNRECARKNLNDIVLKTELAKFYSILVEIIEAYKVERPVLVGTTSIEKSELLASMLDKPLYAMQILETRIKRFLNLAKNKNKENLIDKEFLKLLDKPGNITLEKVSPYTIKLREDFQGEELSFALATMLQAIMVAEEIKKGIKFSVLNAKHHEKEADIIRQAGKLSAITIATNMAGRGTDIILGGYKSNDHDSPDFNIVNLEAQEKVKKLGGLYVIGTERHESRRIDNQLRGRCARQGDLGSSRFFLSLEDNLMRIFGGEKMIGIMNMMKADDDMPIEAGIITEAINNSQKKVESYNFDVRKHVLQYDDVVNTQREVVYRERRKILEGADIHENILKMIKLHIENDLYQYINPKLPTELWFDNSNGELSSIDKLTEQLKNDLGEQILEGINIKDLAEQGFEALEAGLQETALKAYSEKENIIGLDNLKEAERQIMLHVIDSKWVMHLQAMDSLKEGIHLQGYGQKDPLIEYKKESFDMFEDLLLDIKKNTVSLLFHSRIVEKDQHEHEHETAA